MIATNRKVSGEEIFHCAEVSVLERHFFFKFAQPQMWYTYSGMCLWVPAGSVRKGGGNKKACGNWLEMLLYWYIIICMYDL